MPKPRKKIRKVLLSGYTGLGHMILKSVLIRKIEELLPECKIYIICDNNVQDKYPYSGHVGTEFIFPQYQLIMINRAANVFKMIFFFLRMRKEKFDAAIIPIDAAPKLLIRGSIIAGIPLRVGHFFERLPLPNYYYTDSVLIAPQKDRNEIDLNLDLLEALVKKKFRREYRPFIRPNFALNTLEKYNLEKENYICIQMGGKSGHSTTTRWSETNFQSLICRLINEYPNTNIVALGDVGDSEIVNRICQSIDSLRLLNLAGKTNLGETITLIAFCKLIICHDSGLLHIGNALNRNVIAIYGPSQPDYYALNMPSCFIIQKKCDCPLPRPGLFPGIFEPTDEEYAAHCPIPKCMTRISINDVFEKCSELIKINSIVYTADFKFR